MALLLYLFMIYLPLIISRSDTPESFLQGDSFYYHAVIQSLLDDGDLLLANNVPTDPLNGQLAIGTAGFVPKHPILMPLVSLPFYVLSGTPGLLLFNLIDGMILLVLIFKINCLFFDRLIAFVTASIYATATLFFDYAFNYSPDIFSSVLLLGALYLILQKRFYTGAFLLGLSIFAKLPNALPAGLILLYAGFVIWKGDAIDRADGAPIYHKLTNTLLTAMIFILALLPFAYTNFLLFGSPLVTGYQQTATSDENGQMTVVDHSAKFNQPLLKGIAQSLFEPRHGVLLTNPVLILAVLGLAQMKGDQFNAQIFLILTICIVHFLLFAKYDEWSTSHFSNRFLMTFVALSSVFTSNFLSHLGIQSWFDTST